MKRPTAIFFDLDDTLASLNGVTPQAWQDSCKAFLAAHPGAVSYDRLLAAVTGENDDFWSDEERSRLHRPDIPGARRIIVRQAMRHLSIENLAWADELADFFTRRQLELNDLFPWTIETLQALKAEGIRLALITNGSSERQRGKLARYHIDSYFEHIFIEGEMGYGKPDPRAYLHPLEVMKLNPSEVWMVGDNLAWEVEAPMRLGITGIWNDWEGVGLPKGSRIHPDRIIRKVSELFPLPPSSC